MLDNVQIDVHEGFRQTRKENADIQTYYTLIDFQFIGLSILTQQFCLLS